MNKNIVFILILIVNSFDFNWSSKSCDLPNGCEQKKYIKGRIVYICNRLDARFDFYNKSNFSEDKCLPRRSLKIWYFPKYPIILDRSLDLNGINRFRENISSKNMIELEVLLKNFKGFDINAFDAVSTTRYRYPILKLFDNRLDLYASNKKIQTCKDYIDNNSGNVSLFQAFKPLSGITLSKVYFSNSICPLIFNNSIIERFEITNLIDTFYKTSLIRFENSNFSTLNSDISYLFLLDIEKINIDSNVLKPQLFHNVKMFYFFGEIKSIQSNLFQPSNFQHLDTIHIQLHYFQTFVHRQGIEWILYINEDLKINNKNKFNYSLMKYIQIVNNDKGSNVLNLFENKNVNTYFPDEDFCLYINFPFKQNVFIIFEAWIAKNDVSCTLAWLLQYHTDLFYFPNMNSKAIEEAMESCDFGQRRSKCVKSNEIIGKRIHTENDVKSAMIVWQFISIVLTPVICLLGLIANIIVIVVTSSKVNEKTLKEKQYVYIRLKSITNVLILFVQIFNLLSDCQANDSGIYCSSVRKLVAVQYFKIIFVEFFCNYLRFLSNLFHIAFSFNRLALIGKKHTKLTEYISKLSVKKFSTFTLILGLFFTIIKAFRLRANLYFFEWDYPFVYSGLTDDNKKNVQLAISILNCICDVMNGPIFLLFSIIVDVQLVAALKKTTNEKLEKIKQFSSAAQENIKTDLKDAIFRIILMVILNSLVNFILKTPSTIISIIELIKFVYGFRNDSTVMDFGMYDYGFSRLVSTFIKCQYFNACQAFESFSISLFMISIGIDIFFYYNFDKNFKFSFLAVFDKQKTKTSKS